MKDVLFHSGYGFYGNPDQDSIMGEWKSGIDSSHLLDWNDSHNGKSGYFDPTYFQSDEYDGYGSCYVVSDSKKSEYRDKWMVDSGCSDHLTPFLEDFSS